jgi:hypothetical protein
MHSERLHQIVGQLQTEIGAVVPGSGSLTLHFQDGRVQAVEVTLHTRVRREGDRRDTAVAPRRETPTLRR